MYGTDDRHVLGSAVKMDETFLFLGIGSRAWCWKGDCESLMPIVRVMSSGLLII